jgi:hypothetical protein
MTGTKYILPIDLPFHNATEMGADSVEGLDFTPIVEEQHRIAIHRNDLPLARGDLLGVPYQGSPTSGTSPPGRRPQIADYRSQYSSKGGQEREPYRELQKPPPADPGLFLPVFVLFTITRIHLKPPSSTKRSIDYVQESNIVSKRIVNASSSSKNRSHLAKRKSVNATAASSCPNKAVGAVLLAAFKLAQDPRCGRPVYPGGHGNNRKRLRESRPQLDRWDDHSENRDSTACRQFLNPDDAASNPAIGCRLAEVWVLLRMRMS